MSFRRNNERRMSSAVATTTTNTNLPSLDNNNNNDNDSSDEHMDSTDSLPTDLNNRPMTRSLAKLQSSINPGLKSLESQLQNALRSVNSKLISPPPVQTYQKVGLNRLTEPIECTTLTKPVLF